mmetsp:Transcript_15709/g.38606  ORF Transcript_15709/g.38606 Transcript_15709/m.38606 type:complete len:324 (+) Transcript_15709:1916-2887(+)
MGAPGRARGPMRGLRCGEGALHARGSAWRHLGGTGIQVDLGSVVHAPDVYQPLGVSEGRDFTAVAHGCRRQLVSFKLYHVALEPRSALTSRVHGLHQAAGRGDEQAVAVFGVEQHPRRSCRELQHVEHAAPHTHVHHLNEGVHHHRPSAVRGVPARCHQVAPCCDRRHSRRVRGGGQLYVCAHLPAGVTEHKLSPKAAARQQPPRRAPMHHRSAVRAPGPRHVGAKRHASGAQVYLDDLRRHPPNVRTPTAAQRVRIHDGACQGVVAAVALLSVTPSLHTPGAVVGNECCAHRQGAAPYASCGNHRHHCMVVWMHVRPAVSVQ